MLNPTLLKLLLFTFLPSLLPATCAFPAAVDPPPPSRRSRVVGTESSGSDTTPVVIWHGLGDEYDAPGLKSLGEEIRGRYPGKLVYFVRMDNDSSKDRKATFFGNANEQVDLAASQISDLPFLSRGFDAIGFSQGGQLLRAYVERYNRPPVRNLITLGAQHMGVSEFPACNPLDIFCRLGHIALKSGVYSSYAQENLVPAQYWRDQLKIDEYLEVNEFLRDINNERVGDEQVGDRGLGLRGGPAVPRNETYRKNFKSLNRFVMFKFSDETTVNPPTSPYFTLLNHTSEPATPVEYLDLPLYRDDYIGLRDLDERGRVAFGVCEGRHMQIGRECWDEVLGYLSGDGDGDGDGEVEEGMFVLQVGSS